MDLKVVLTMEMVAVTSDFWMETNERKSVFMQAQELLCCVPSQPDNK
jgi:hypothetical protein